VSNREQIMSEAPHAIEQVLVELRIIDPEAVETFFPSVRDRDDIAVKRCTRSGVIYLSRCDHMHSGHYQDKDDFGYWSGEDRQQATRSTREDDTRRAAQFEYLVRNRRWLDVGTGAGGILDLLSPLADRCAAVEPQQGARRALTDAGYEVFTDITEAARYRFDVVTLFHVFEHLTEPLEALRHIHHALEPGGEVVIEVPHANDLLLTTLDLDAFKAFTFWSEHLILHTRDSLHRFLAAAGFADIEITGLQRYPLANHLHWLARGAPGGHQKWGMLRDAQLDRAYADTLARLGRTDTLVAVARKPAA
jgi:2-polyprenyl-3-methyl-5-hydroxy-6-metoxy-1,4-benzoquinol methylase